MNEFRRMLDANFNRACEGLRVCEDWARFSKNNSQLSKECKQLRHEIRSIADKSNCLFSRNSDSDVGLSTSQSLKCDNRLSTIELLKAGCKRTQEALRTIEETLKLTNMYDLSKQAELLRFKSYSIEKKLLSISSSRASWLKSCGIYGITAEKFSLGRTNLEVAELMLKSGIKVIQYREKHKKAGEKYKECTMLKKLTSDYDAKFIVNDDIDIAIACDADGVHIGQDDLPIEQVRKLVGDKVIGLSTHSKEQAQDAIARGADYIGVGPIFETQTKDDVCAAVGLSYLEYVSQNLDIPFVAIGGIKEHNISQVTEKGAGCICLVTEIVGAKNIAQKIELIKNIMENAM